MRGDTVIIFYSFSAGIDFWLKSVPVLKGLTGVPATEFGKVV